MLTYHSIKRTASLCDYIWIVYDIEVKYHCNNVLLVCYDILDSHLVSLGRGYFKNFSRFVLMVYGKSQSQSIVLCAHNGNRYDHMFFLDRFVSIVSSDKYTTNRLSLPLLSIHIGNNRIVFRDTLRYFASSLKSIGQCYDLPKLECALDAEFDFTTWLPYCERDVEICVAVLRHTQSLIAKTTFECLAQTYSLADIAFNISIQLIRFDVTLTINEELKNVFDHATYGGRTYSSIFGQQVRRPISVIDANSMYPSCMTFDYPSGEISIESSRVVGRLGIYYVELRRAFVSCEDATRAILPVVLTKGESKTGLAFFDHGFVRGWYTSVDIDLFVSRGWSVVYRIGFVWSDVCTKLGDLYKTWYSDRKLYPKHSPMSDLIKRQMNSSYGKYLQLKSAHYDRPSFIGTFLLSYSRCILNRMMMLCSDGPLLYTDTDSIFVDSCNDSYITDSMLVDELTLDVQVPRVKIESHHDSLIVVAKKVYGLTNPLVIKSKGFPRLSFDQLVDACRRTVAVSCSTTPHRFEFLSDGRMYCMSNNVTDNVKKLSMKVPSCMYRCDRCDLYHSRCIIN